MNRELLEPMRQDYVNGYTFKQLGVKYHHGAASVWKWFQSYNIPCRNTSEGHIKKKCDYTFFKEINTEEKAYWLGFLYADGSMYNQKYHNMIGLTLSIKDEQHLRKFKSILGSEHKLSYHQPGCASFVINNQEMFEDLNRLGCVERKSFTIQFPTEKMVPQKLIHHFMRGFFDGDGCITYHLNTKQNLIKWKFSMSVPHDFGIVYGKYMLSSCGIDVHLYLDPRISQPLYSLEAAGSRPEKLMKIYDFLYKNATLYLERKKEKFIQIKEGINKQNKPKLQKRQNLVKILRRNRHKTLREVAKILNTTNNGWVCKQYKKYGINRQVL
jgi:intein-encoded DNA endonuclease-like protein